MRTAEEILKKYGLYLMTERITAAMEEYAEEKVFELLERAKSSTSSESEIKMPTGNATDFEMELYSLITRYINAGLKKPDLVHKMEYVTQTCRVS